MRSALLLLLLSFLVGLNGAMAQRQNNTVINVGALFTFNSTIGRSARLAIELALQDVNADPSILAGSTLNIIMQDTKCNGFLGITEALQLLEKDVVAIIGPQSSGISHVVSHVVNELHVPLLSFAATDPDLSSLEYPYFIRTIHSDYFQMNAVADMIQFYGWREVTAIFVDDDYGRGGITALGDALAKKLSKISYKAGFPPGAESNVINDLLVQVNLMESRVYVVHANPDTGINIFAIAKRLGMLDSGYVWIATDWLESNIDSSPATDPNTMSLLQGVITLRHHTVDSVLKRNFLSSWRDMLHKGNASSNLNTYGMFAYDSVWLVARAVDQFLKGGQALNFSNDPRVHDVNGSSLRLSRLQSFNGGEQLLQQLLLANFTGLTGQIQFDSDRNIIRPAYEILNIVGQTSHLIGYWSSYSGLSVVAPEVLYNKPKNISTSSQQLYSVVWPGQTTNKPRGWVFPNNGKKLRIGVPNKVSFKQLISNSSDIENLSGLCIDIFNAAVKLLPYPVPFSFVLIGNGYENPNYDAIINMVAQNDLDAAVGDIAIVRNRTRIVDFTQPYIESGLAIVVPVHEKNSSAWAFLKPFTLEMWCVTGAFFLFVGAVVWILEHRLNPDFRGTPRKQIMTICWFSFSTMFFAHRENTVSSLGRFVLIVWMFVVLIITSSYTASLTSILTVQQLSSGIKGLDSLLSSPDPIGYQVGKFAYNYMIDELGIHESRLKPLNTVEDYAKALQLGPKNGGVSAIVDEVPYIQILLSAYCNKFRIVGQEFTKNGWGFAFQRDSPLAVDLSTAILALSEKGDLQRIHDKWMSLKDCDAGESDIDANRLSLRSFWGLFVVCAGACFLALVVFFVRICNQFMNYNSAAAEKFEDSVAVEKPPERLKSFKDLILFVDKKEKDVKDVLKRKSSEKQHQSARTSDAPSESPA